MVGSTDESVGRVGSVDSVAVGSAVGKASLQCPHGGGINAVDQFTCRRRHIDAGRARHSEGYTVERRRRKRARKR